MMTRVLYLFLLGCLIVCQTTLLAQHNPGQTVAEWQTEMNEEFADPEESPLTVADLREFESLEFFPVSEAYRFEARFVRTPNQVPFQMPTTTPRRAIYEKFGEVHFTYEGKEYALDVYESHSLRDSEEYQGYLFLPFLDASNGFATYGGGRYLSLYQQDITEEGTLVVDFNKAYNPYCAYSDRYSCPIVPKENYLGFKVEAGVKAFGDH